MVSQGENAPCTLLGPEQPANVTWWILEPATRYGWMKLTRPGRRLFRRFKREGVCLSLMQGCMHNCPLVPNRDLSCLGSSLVTCLPRHDEVISVALDNQPVNNAVGMWLVKTR